MTSYKTNLYYFNKMFSYFDHKRCHQWWFSNTTNKPTSIWKSAIVINFDAVLRALVNYEYNMMFVHLMRVHMKTISQINNQNLGFALIWLIFLRLCIPDRKGFYRRRIWLAFLFVWAYVVWVCSFCGSHLNKPKFIAHIQANTYTQTHTLACFQRLACFNSAFICAARRVHSV